MAVTRLKDTVRNMLSNDYKNRLMAERDQLTLRIEGLREIVKKIESGEQLSFRVVHPKELFKKQLEAMEKYLEVLEERMLYVSGEKKM